MKSLKQKAILYTLHISQWSARKYDKKVTQEIEQEHDAKNTGNFNKVLIAVENELKEIQKIANAARTFFYDNTLPWGKNGEMIVPNTNLLSFITDMRVHKQRFDEAVEAFILKYPQRKQEAKQRLKTMYEETDYPTVQEIKGKFQMEITPMAVADLTDWRLETDQEEINDFTKDIEEKLRTEIQSELSDRLTNTTITIAERMHKAVSHMVSKLKEQPKNEDNDNDVLALFGNDDTMVAEPVKKKRIAKKGEGPLFRDSLVENIRQLVDVLPRLNITGNQQISALIDDMKKLLVEPDDLRQNVNLRNKTAEEAQAILDKINQFLA